MSTTVTGNAAMNITAVSALLQLVTKWLIKQDSVEMLLWPLQLLASNQCSAWLLLCQWQEPMMGLEIPKLSLANSP